MFYPIKELGQNFLLDKEIARKLVDALTPLPTDFFVEIGPGLGVLTQELVNRVGEDANIYAVEIDKRFVENLKLAFLDLRYVKIIEADILKWLPEFDYNQPYKLIGSLPYYITSPIIHEIVKKPNRAQTVVILIQKEVAEKIFSKAPDSSYMSSFVQTYYDVEYLGMVPREKFKPAPKVDSGILRLTLKNDIIVPEEKTDKYEGFLHKAYSNPRKMLNKVFSDEALEVIGVSGNLRAQNIDAQTWAEAFIKLNV